MVREAVEADADALAALGERTFRETFLDGFGIPYPETDLAAWVPVAFGAARCRARIADPACRMWVAEREGMPVGFAAAGPCGLPHPEATSAHGELYQLYLLREAQGSGLGGALLTGALAWLETRYPGPLWLGVWSGNEKAQQVYARRGFRRVGEYQFPVGAWRDDEFIFCRD